MWRTPRTTWRIRKQMRANMVLQKKKEQVLMQLFPQDLLIPSGISQKAKVTTHGGRILRMPALETSAGALITYSQAKNYFPNWYPPAYILKSWVLTTAPLN